MDGLPLTSMTTEELLAKAQEELATANLGAENARSEVVALNGKITELETALASESKIKAELEAKVATFAQDLDQAKAKVAELEALDKSAERKAAKIASGCGVAPVAVSPVSTPSKSREEAVAEMNKITDPAEKQKFFLANQKVLLGI